MYAVFASLHDAEPDESILIEMEPDVADGGGGGDNEVFSKPKSTPTKRLSRTGTWLKPKPKVRVNFKL